MDNKRKVVLDEVEINQLKIHEKVTQEKLLPAEYKSFEHMSLLKLILFLLPFVFVAYAYTKMN